MSKIVADNQMKQKLGIKITELRKSKNISQRELARQIHVPNSNMKYFEDGINVPSPETYSNIIAVLSPTVAQRRKMDSLYSAVRGTPPPDVCKIMIENNELNDAIRLLEKKRLSSEESKKIREFIQNLVSEKEATING